MKGAFALVVAGYGIVPDGCPGAGPGKAGVGVAPPALPPALRPIY